MSIDFTAAARIEIFLAAGDLKESHGERTANAFRRRLQATLDRLAAAPEAVALVDPPFEELPGLRVVPVDRFKARLLFFQKTDTGILVLHVLHSASDWQTTLGGDGQSADFSNPSPAARLVSYNYQPRTVLALAVPGLPP